jgi:hypothetical protein
MVMIMENNDELHNIAGVLNSLRSSPKNESSLLTSKKMNEYDFGFGPNSPSGTKNRVTNINDKNKSTHSMSPSSLDNKCIMARGRDKISKRKILRSSSPQRISAETPSRPRSSSCKRRMNTEENDDTDSVSSYDSDINVFNDGASVVSVDSETRGFRLKRRAVDHSNNSHMFIPAGLSNDLKSIKLASNYAKDQARYNCDFEGCRFQAFSISELKGHFRLHNCFVCTKESCLYHCNSALDMNIHRKTHDITVPDHNSHHPGNIVVGNRHAPLPGYNYPMSLSPSYGSVAATNGRRGFNNAPTHLQRKNNYGYINSIPVSSHQISGMGMHNNLSGGDIHTLKSFPDVANSVAEYLMNTVSSTNGGTNISNGHTNGTSLNTSEINHRMKSNTSSLSLPSYTATKAGAHAPLPSSRRSSRSSSPNTPTRGMHSSVIIQQSLPNKTSLESPTMSKKSIFLLSAPLPSSVADVK